MATLDKEKALKGASRIIHSLLSRYQVYRDDDKKLILAVWRRQGLVLDEYQKEKFFEVSDAQYIKRERRALRGLYPASPKVEAKRYRQFLEVRENYQGKTPDVEIAQAKSAAEDRKEGLEYEEAGQVKKEHRGFLGKIINIIP